jgi:hypothetical protein
MRRTLLCALLFGLFTPFSLSAECPCIPLTHLWVVKTCADWNCASTELLLGAGDPQVMAIPVAMDDTRWLVVRRMISGAAIDITDDPFQLQQFDGMEGAAVRYTALTHDRRPMLLTAPDGQILVISLKQAEPRRRAVAR